MKFQHLSETYKATFEALDDGKRFASPAVNKQVVLALHPQWGRNEYTGFSQYADSRIYESKGHEQAMVDVEKIVKWRE